MTEGEERPDIRPVPPLPAEELAEKEPLATIVDGVITNVNYQSKPELKVVEKPIEDPTFTSPPTEADKGPSFTFDPDQVNDAARRKVMGSVVRLDDFRRKRR